MIVRIERDVLRAALAKVKPAVGKHSLPSLVGVMITATDVITFTATNLDVHITCGVDGTAGTAGRALVPFDRLAALAAKCPAGAVALEYANEELTVHAGPVTAVLRCIPPEGFPSIPELVDATEHKLDDDWRAIGRTLHALSENDSRPNLCNVRISEQRVSCTDSFRMARHAVSLDGDLLLPPAPIKAATAQCPNGPVVLRFDERRFELEADGTVWSGSLSQADYPTNSQMDRLWPAETACTFRVDCIELTDALKVIGVVGAGESDGKTMSYVLSQLTVGGDLVAVSSKATDVGNVNVEIDAKTSGEVDVAFNGNLLAQLLGALVEENVELKGNDSLKPWISVDGGLEQLIMPVRVGKS